MKIKTKLTVILLASYIIVIILFVGIIGRIFLMNQESNLKIFKNELLLQNSKLLEDSARLFFNLIDVKFFEGKSREEALEYIKNIDQLNRSVVAFDTGGKSLLKGHSREEIETLISKKIIETRLEELQTKNIKNFTRDNFEEFQESSHTTAPVKVYLQIYSSQGLILGYGQLLEDIKTRLIFLERRNEKSQETLLVITFLIIVSGVLVVVLAALLFSNKWIFKPLETLVENFGLVAKGELFHRMEVRSDDEIGKLTGSFNYMTESLNQSVNEIRAANIKLDSYSRELESRVSRRTQELSDAVVRLKREIEERKLIEEALERARSEAESANISKSQFLANMSHEIRTPMNAVIGMAELVLDTKLNAEQREYLLTLKSSSESLLGLLNDILDLSKIEVGKLDVEPIEFHFRKCVTELAKNMSVQAQRKDIELIIDIDLDIPNMVIGDPGRLRQILTNLIGNAIKFTHTGIIVARVKMETRETNAGEPTSEIFLKFTISDTGIGIPEDKQRLIFEKFYQTDSSITRKFGGTGLGLAISMQLARLMGGKISVQSPGELNDVIPGAPGSSFFFSLVFKTAKDKNDPGEPIDIKELKGLRVLVVDDNSINRVIYDKILKRWGLEPTLVDSGMKALEVLKQAIDEKKEFRLILSDVRMPGMDGFELVKRIREEKLVGHTRIIMLTSGGVKGDGKVCRDLGISAYLRKPAPSAELLETFLIVMGSVTQEKKEPQLVTVHSLKESKRQLNILVAEDNLINQKLIRRILEKMGCAIDIANNGKETVEKVKEGHYDVILMDIQMPEMDGVEATIAIRENEKNTGSAATPIIALTAHAMKGDKERFIEAGMNSYISKPIKSSELIEMIETLSMRG